MAKTYRIGTRTSPLALKQVEEILLALRRFYPDFKTEIIGIDTYGDKDKVTPISQIEGTDFFTREIDEALLKDKVDFAVHSAKDLPDTVKEGLVVAAQTKSIDPYDALVSRNGLKLAELPQGARIGTSSIRRKTQLSKYRDDFDIVGIRGNIEERLEKLDAGDLDAIVIAASGLVRLGLEKRITERIPLEIIKPHPLQGALAIVTRSGSAEVIKLVSVLDVRKNGSFDLEGRILEKMEGYFGPDTRRIHHAWQVLKYAKEISQKEGGDSGVIAASAILHDIGIKECEKKYNSTGGQLQEKEGPPIARSILRDLHVSEEIISEVCQIIASHHSPGEIDTLNFKILWDADWLVNLKDEYHIKDKQRLVDIIEKTFLTETGKMKARGIYIKDGKE
ncbi:MAG: hydroxymethylbilane synthase [Candidatus Omnitrophica bacterium CG07_land_8_20_14_0_80_42_15]|uniref:Hydroxymethylbilane synthase n=1 Tax=Candidatus Aquitaenariimonas noxiae TaxID=1974741 RepID=A0A2J0KV75_9BACT|nr:MAG: hydroxymethylbilane synthase [Candidatus Omnitrophica bacterium CG07_land_8_20_14_0_80_42_15]